MVSNIAAKSILDESNSFFKGNAEARINGSRLEITIGSQTLIISLPEAIGWQSKGSS